MMRTLVLLRPIDAGNGRLRLGFYTEEWREIIGQNPPDQVRVQLHGAHMEEAALATYRDYGSLTSTQINLWLHGHDFQLNAANLLFELYVNEQEGVHTFRLIGKVEEVVD